MKKLGLILLAITSLGLVGCDWVSWQPEKDFEACDKVHINGFGCVSKDDCKLVHNQYYGYAIKYHYDSNSVSTITDFMLVKGRCPICKK